MKPSEHSVVARFMRIEPFLLGTALSGLSSLAYSCSNVCLRWLAHCDPLLVSCIKAVPTLLVATTLVALSAARGNMRWPSFPAFLGLAAVGVIAQLGGNGLFQWSMSEVGLALTVPLCAGTMIIAASALARVWLHEGVTPRSALALAILITAIAVLSLGAERAPQLAELATADASITAALSAACFSGVCYAILNVTIRRLVTGDMPMHFVLSTVSSVGVVSLGLAAIARTGWEPLAATELTDLGVMFIAGTFNAIGFFTLTKALQLVSIVQVNAVSASQSALAAMAGVAIFGESMTASLLVGVTLTIIGLTMVDRGKTIGRRPSGRRPAETPADEAFVAPPAGQLPDAAALPREPTTT
ncbi:MAG TPA: DMT family transporter [Pirellulales bacterium]|nr:DMT family transporter [Pirellulales bacterium]